MKYEELNDAILYKIDELFDKFKVQGKTSLRIALADQITALIKANKIPAGEKCECPNSDIINEDNHSGSCNVCGKPIGEEKELTYEQKLARQQRNATMPSQKEEIKELDAEELFGNLPQEFGEHILIAGRLKDKLNELVKVINEMRK